MKGILLSLVVLSTGLAACAPGSTKSQMGCSTDLTFGGVDSGVPRVKCGF